MDKRKNYRKLNEEKNANIEKYMIINYLLDVIVFRIGHTKKNAIFKEKFFDSTILISSEIEFYNFI